MGVKTAISVPDGVFERAEAAAKRLNLSRSQLYSDAVEEYLNRLGGDPVTEALNALADEFANDDTPNPGRVLIASGQWQW